MSNTFLTEIEPNLGFVRDLLEGGAASLESCYQCATCSTVCPLSSDGNPFPRKEMIWAQWGQMDKLINNPDVWLCHQCNDCVTYCPRDAKPGDLMAAVRKFSFGHFATPGFMGKIFQKAITQLYLLAVPVIILFLALIFNNSLTNVPRGVNGEIVFDFFIPTITIDLIFIPFALFAVFAIVLSLRRFWGGLKEHAPPAKDSKKSIVSSIIKTVMDIAFHTRFKKCGTNKDRSIAHAMVLWGFVGLFITTNIGFVYIYGYLVGILDQPYAPPSTLLDTLSFSVADANNAMGGLASHHPQLHYTAPYAKLFGYFSAFLFIVGGINLMINRMKTKLKTTNTTYDWVFMMMLLLTGLTGAISPWLRGHQWAALAYPNYFIHLVFVFYIIAYLPYSKLAHMAYRFTAMVYSTYTGRDAEIILSEEASNKAA